MGKHADKSNEQIYQLGEDGVTMTATEPTENTALVTTESVPSRALMNTSVQHAYEITEYRNEALIGYGDDPFEVVATVNVPRRNKVFTFIGKGKTIEEANKKIDVDVRREVSFWRFCIGVNRNEERFPSKPIDYEKRREPQLYHGGESDVTRATAPITGQTHPHRHSG